MLFILFACFTPYTILRVRGQAGEYVHAVLCCCSCPLCVCKGDGANLNTVKRIVTYTGIKPIFFFSLSL